MWITARMLRLRSRNAVCILFSFSCKCCIDSAVEAERLTYRADIVLSHDCLKAGSQSLWSLNILKKNSERDLIRIVLSDTVHVISTKVTLESRTIRCRCGIKNDLAKPFTKERDPKGPFS